MSVMAVNQFLTPPSKALVTAIFNGISLLFIKQPRVMINYRGTHHESDLFPVFCSRMIRRMLTPIAFPPTPEDHALEPSRARKTCSRSCLGAK